MFVWRKFWVEPANDSVKIERTFAVLIKQKITGGKNKTFSIWELLTPKFVWKEQRSLLIDANGKLWKGKISKYHWETQDSASASKRSAKKYLKLTGKFLNLIG